MVLSSGGIKECFSKQFGMIKKEGEVFVGGVCFFGEIGIPFDMDDKKSYKIIDSWNKYRNARDKVLENVYRKQEMALDANMSALDKNLLSFTLWNYCDLNSHEWGDCWNGEDLSLFSYDDVEYMKYLRESKRRNKNKVNSEGKLKKREDTVDSGFSYKTKASGDILLTPLSSGESDSETDTLKEKFNLDLDLSLNDGARAIKAFLRPYPMKTCGEPLEFSFDYKKILFKFRFKSNSSGNEKCKIGEGTEIFLPVFQFGLPKAMLESLNEKKGKSKESEGGYFTFPGMFDSKIIDEIDCCFEVSVSDGRWTFDVNSQILHYFHADGCEHEIAVRVCRERHLCRIL